MQARGALGAEPAALAVELSLLLLLWARLLPLALLAPFLRLPKAPPVVWLATSSALTMCLWPAARAASPALPTSLLALLPLLLRELLIGVVYGVALSLPLWAVGWGGQLLDQLRGSASHSEDGSALGQLYLWLAIAIFFAVGGHRLAIESLSESVRSLPLGVPRPAKGLLELSLDSARLVAQALATALALIMPVALSLLAAELCVALALRARSALAGFAALPGARALWVLAVVLLGLPSLLQAMPAALARGLRQAEQLLLSL